MTLTSERATDRPALADVDTSPEALARVTAEIAVTAPEHDRSGAVPRAGLEAAHRAGLLTASVGTQYGGPGLGLVDTARVLVALGEGDASVGLLAANNLNTHAGQASNPHWPAAAYDDLLRRSQQGPALANAIRAEPELGVGAPPDAVARLDDGDGMPGLAQDVGGGEPGRAGTDDDHRFVASGGLHGRRRQEGADQSGAAGERHDGSVRTRGCGDRSGAISCASPSSPSPA